MTQHHHTPPPDPMPLDPEERALAARLARLGPHGEPSPALDARVLAAAHAAAVSQQSRRAREHGWRRARWPVGVGVAASVVLAAGIAWQMRPLPPPQLSAGAAARDDAAMASAPGPASAVAASGDAPTPALARVAPVPPSQAARAATGGADTAPAAAPSDNASGAFAAKSLASPAPRPPPPEAPPVVFDTPAPAAAAASPPGPPAPPAPAAPAPPVAAAQAAGELAQAQAPLSASRANDANDADAPEGDVPPATVASPEVRDAWLSRIRELAAAGRTDEARASLAEFHRRYPAFAIPADLRPLLPAAPTAPAAPAPSGTPAAAPAPAPASTPQLR